MTGFPKHEVVRKLIHLTTSLLPISLLIIGPEPGVSLVAVILILAIILDVVRLRFPSVKRLFERVFGESLRPHEANALTGSTFMCIGGLACILIFEVSIAATALLFLTVGDSAAALIGLRWGRTRLVPGKTLEGSLACLIMCIIIVVVVPGVPFAVGIVGALVATVVELFGTRIIDDNLGIPILSALAMWITASAVI